MEGSSSSNNNNNNKNSSKSNNNNNNGKNNNTKITSKTINNQLFSKKGSEFESSFRHKILSDFCDSF